VSGVDVDEPQLRKAFELRKERDAGIALTRDDIPNIIVYDLMKVIESEVSRYKQKKQKEMERKQQQMKSRM